MIRASVNLCFSFIKVLEAFDDACKDEYSKNFLEIETAKREENSLTLENAWK